MIHTCDVRLRLGHGDRRSRHWPPRIAAGTRRRLIKEILLIAAFTVLYEEIRDHMAQAGAVAAGHALLIVSVEKALGIFREHSVQAAIIGNPAVTAGFNAYYGGTHFLIPAFVLVWLFVRHPAHYARARTSLAVITGLAFVCFWLFPEAPPRLLPASFGIVDTLVAGGSGHFETALMNTAGDEYASMPSVHVAWAVWCTLALWPVLRHWALRALAVAYPCMTTLVVVATGNHYFLDVVAGALLACVTWIVVTRAGAWLTVRIATKRAEPVARSRYLRTRATPDLPTAAPLTRTGTPSRRTPTTSSSISAAPRTARSWPSTTPRPARGTRYRRWDTRSCAIWRGMRCRRPRTFSR